MQIFYFILLSFFIATNLFAQQKVVLISGATSGIGLATTTAFHEKGWKVWAGCRQRIPEELKEMKNVRLCPLDVTNDRQIQATVEAILKEDGRIDALINNAGYGLIGAEECVTIDEAQHLFDVNFFGALRLIQGVLPVMRQQKTGNILNISSGAGVHPLPGLGLYCASKFALEGLTESLAASLSPWNIKVSIIEPGFVKNNWGKHCMIGSRACHEEIYKKLTIAMCNMLAVPRGQPCQEVAALLVQIAETPQPDLRYQTTIDMKQYIAETLIDPTGNKTLEQNINFLNKMIK
jgi:NAD(P)-dependent dehydrogenase (short-subunit alcohol dehydrogenase family)